ncbi:MAG: DsbA family protein [Gemmatimonadota bacterium]|nr:DsbA family protein [Gemmatimonadota bacterium]
MSAFPRRAFAAVALMASFAWAPGPASGQAIDIGDLGFPAGSPDAPVQVVEFSDFSCPYCREFHSGTYQTLHAGYVATNKVRWIYVPFASGQYPNSFAAAAVAECAGRQDHFDTVRDRLYETQDDWKHEDEPTAGAHFLSIVEDLSVDRDALIACATSSDVATRIDRARELAARVGVTGTPAYVIDGFPAVGALPAEFIGQVLDARLAQLGHGPAESR